MALTEWIYNSNTGAVNELPTPVAELELHSGLGWHGPFSSQQEAVTYYNNNAGANPGWKRPTGGIANLTGNAAASGVEKITGTSTFNLGSWVLRIGEILLGIVLIGVGIAKLTGTTNTIAKLAKAAI